MKLARIALASTLVLAAFAGSAQAGGYGYGGYGYGHGYSSYNGHGYGWGHRSCYWKFDRYFDEYRHIWFTKKVYVCS